MFKESELAYTAISLKGSLDIGWQHKKFQAESLPSKGIRLFKNGVFLRPYLELKKLLGKVAFDYNSLALDQINKDHPDAKERGGTVLVTIIENPKEFTIGKSSHKLPKYSTVLSLLLDGEIHLYSYAFVPVMYDIAKLYGYTSETLDSIEVSYTAMGEQLTMLSMTNLEEVALSAPITLNAHGDNRLVIGLEATN